MNAGTHDARCFFECIKIKPCRPSDVARRAGRENRGLGAISPTRTAARRPDALALYRKAMTAAGG